MSARVSARVVAALCTVVALASASPIASALDAAPGVGAQYDSTHVYVAPDDVDRFVASFIATFGGSSGKQSVATVTPTPSRTTSQLIQTPVGLVSLFGYKTPIPYPFGAERTGWLVTDMDEAIRDAQAAGADILVAPFDDPIGRDAIIQWPGGLDTQLYWHTIPPTYPPLQTAPENRVYVSPDAVEAFIRSFVRFSLGRVASDDPHAPGVEIGRPDETYRRIRLESTFGKMTVFVTDGHLPHPCGRETTGYEVANLAETMAKAKAAGVAILVAPHTADGRDAAMVQFPGGYIAEIHAVTGK